MMELSSLASKTWDGAWTAVASRLPAALGAGSVDTEAQASPSSPALVLQLSPPARDALVLDDLSRSFDQAVAMGEAFRTEVEQAVEGVRWLLRLMGQEDPIAERADDAGMQRLSAEIRRKLDEYNGTVVVHQQTLQLRIDEVRLTVRQGTDAIEISVGRVSVQATSTTVAAVGERRRQDPLVLDLAGDGVRLAPTAKSFDIDGDGDRETVSWVGGDDALLAMDRDGDGKITSGKELFGDQNGASDGFAELAKLDDNGDGVIDAGDRAWSALILIREKGDARTLAEEGITSLRFDVLVPLDQEVEGGRLVAAGMFTTADGAPRPMVEALFDVSA